MADEPLTFDEILEDKTYQSEFDKRVSKALETAKAKWEAGAEAARTKAQEEAEASKKAAVEEATGKLETALTKAMIQTELVKAKVRDVDVVLPLIDTEKVTRGEKGLEGLKEQIDELKTSKGYLFEQEEQQGGRRGKSGLEHEDDDPKAEEEKIKRIMGLPI